MNATVVRLAGSRRRPDPWAGRGKCPIEPTLPLDPKDFAGRLVYWPESRVEEHVFDRVLRLGGVQTIVDLRDDPLLGGLRSLHHLRCHAIDRWCIGYFRLGPLFIKAERAALLPFEVSRLFVANLSVDVRLSAALRERPKLGAVVVIFPEDGARLQIFLNACRSLGLSAFEALPFKLGIRR